MRYLLVGDRLPKEPTRCGHCTEFITEVPYLRDLETAFRYHGLYCYTKHVELSQQAIGGTDVVTHR